MVLLSFRKGFQVANKSLLLVLAIGLLGIGYNLAVSPITGPIQKVMAPYQGPNPKPMEWAAVRPVLPQIIFMIVLGFLVSTFFQAGLWGYVAKKQKTDQGSIPDFFKFGARLFRPMALLILFGIGFGLVTVLASIVPMVLAGVLASLTKSITAVPQIIVLVGVLAMLAVLSYALYLGLLYFGMATPAIVANDKKVMDSLKESKSFIQGARFWPFVGLTTLYTLVAIAVYLLSIFVAVLTRSGAVPVAGIGIQPVQIASAVVFGIIFLYFDIAVKAGFVNYYLSANNNTSVANSA